MSHPYRSTNGRLVPIAGVGDGFDEKERSLLVERNEHGRREDTSTKMPPPLM